MAFRPEVGGRELSRYVFLKKGESLSLGKGGC